MNSADVREFLVKKELSFCDTQVKYGEEYSYVVTAYQAVFGTNYYYGNVRTYDPFNPAAAYDNRWAKIDVTMTPVVKLIEIPVFMSTGKILDNPPLAPEVMFYPLKGDRNKLNMFFTTSTGEVDLEPVSLTMEEAENIEQLTINQNRNDGKLTFKTDDSASSFYIYRLLEPPVVLEDFADNLYSTVSTKPEASVNSLQASSATATITQLPNQKYYYIFRTVDVHGHLSNPSVVYEIELYNDGGAGYPIIRHYDLASPEAKAMTKSARKIIQIVPRISQAFLNEEKSGLIDAGVLQNAIGNRNIVLGNEDEALFGKKFKIRLTSKSTGKKLDINVNFKTKRIRGEIE